MSRMLLDECMSPQLVPKLWGEGYDVIHVRDRGLLSASDHTVWNYALSEDRTICTINAIHFKRLAASTDMHPGVLVFPSGHAPSSQFSLVMAALTWITTSNVQMGFVNRYIEVGDDGGIVLAEIVYDEKAWGDGEVN